MTSKRCHVCSRWCSGLAADNKAPGCFRSDQEFCVPDMHQFTLKKALTCRVTGTGRWRQQDQLIERRINFVLEGGHDAPHEAPLIQSLAYIQQYFCRPYHLPDPVLTQGVGRALERLEHIVIPRNPDMKSPFRDVPRGAAAAEPFAEYCKHRHRPANCLNKSSRKRRSCY